MKVQQTSVLILVGVVSAAAFTPSSRGITSASSRAFANIGIRQNYGIFTSSHKVGVGIQQQQHRKPASISSTTAVPMILDRLFGGGAMGAGIAYENLDHPGPELATAAKAGKVLSVSEKDPNLKIATFAGGCFWGLELAYQRVPGVVYTCVGYCQGKEQEPTYGQVCAGTTGHTEAVTVYYDPKECTYEQLLDTFFERVNPTTVNGQGNDFGTQYRTGVYPTTPDQMVIAKQRFELEQKKYSRPIASELMDAKPFWPAEKYHQQYLEKGGRNGRPQNASKGATEPIRCYG